MNKRLTAVIPVILTALAAVSCGRKGPLELPPAAVPVPIEKPAAFQRGDGIVVEWTNPAKYLDGHPAELGSVELWAMEIKPGSAPVPGGRTDPAREAGLVRRIQAAEFASLMAPAAAGTAVLTWTFRPAGKEAGSAFDIYLRALDRRRRASDFSAPVRVVMDDCPLPPSGVSADVSQDAIELSWERPAAMTSGPGPVRLDGYAVYRREGEGRLRLIGTADGDRTSLEDRDFVFGAAYSYLVRAFRTAGGARIESADSAVCAVLPIDGFAPPAPAEATAVAGPEGISVSWPASPGGDVRGYFVRRRESGEKEYVLLEKDPVRATSYIDGTVKPGATYEYAVSACDRNGNESPPTKTAPVRSKGAVT